MGGSKKVTVGYWYYMDIHMWLGHEIEALLELQCGERSFWSGNMTSSGTIEVKASNLFGGKKREGGLLGLIDFMKGDDSQPVNPGLQDSIRSATGNPSQNIPAFRGVSSLVFRGVKSGVDFSGTPWSNDVSFSPFPINLAEGEDLLRSSFMWSAMNPYFKALRAKVQNRWDGWYPEKAKIGDQMNPAHIIYRVLTNPSWSSGLPTAIINDSNFRAAADTLYDENFGLGLKWASGTTVKEFIQLVLDHINGTLTTNLTTGEFELILARDDYDVGSIIELNKDNCRVLEVSRRGLAETSNEVVVTYTRPEDGEADTVAAQNTGNIAIQGRIITTEKNYPGVHDAALAAKLAFRDLQVLSQPITKISLEVDRTGTKLPPGSVFKLVYPVLGFQQVVFRVAQRDLGSLESGRITIQAVEDVFSAPVIEISAPQPPQWVDTSRPPEPVVEYLTTELPYYILITTTNQAERDEWPPEVGFIQTCALNPNPDASTFTMYDNDASVELDNSTFSFTGTTVTVVGHEETVFTLHNFSQYYKVVTPEVAYLGEELILVTALDNNTGQVTVQRAVYDTVPVEHPAETRVFFLGPESQNFAADPTTRVLGEDANLKYLTNTSQGELSPASAPLVSYTIQNRFDRPYPPAAVRLNGEFWPEEITGDITILWAHRDRVLQQDVATSWFDPGDIGPEPGTSYTVSVESDDGSIVLYTQSGITGASNLVDALNYSGPVKIRLISQRDGFSNWQAWECVVKYIPATITVSSDDIPADPVENAIPVAVAFTAAPGQSPFTWTILSGAIPVGTTLDASTGVLTGSPTVDGVYDFVVQAEDSQGFVGNQSFQMSVTSLPMIVGGDAPDGEILTEYQFQPGTINIDAPITWSIISGSLPGGVSLNGSTGELSGVVDPTEGGDFTFELQADGSAMATREYTINISGTPGYYVTQLFDGTNFILSIDVPVPNVGTRAWITHSTDTDNWNLVQEYIGLVSPSNIAYGLGVYVACGGTNHTSIADSLSGPWTYSEITNQAGIGGLLFDGSRFVISGGNGNIYTRTDLADWSEITSNNLQDPDRTILSMVYDGTYYYCHSIMHTSDLFEVWRSTDLNTWTKIYDHSGAGGIFLVERVAIANSLVCICGMQDVGGKGRPLLLTSADNGDNWTDHSPSTIDPGEPSWCSIDQITYFQGKFLIFGASLDGHATTLGNWTVSVYAGQSFATPIQDSTTCLVTRYRGGDRVVLKTTDGINWVIIEP